jgi:hypothetical protein
MYDNVPYTFKMSNCKNNHDIGILFVFIFIACDIAVAQKLNYISYQHKEI